MIHGEQLGAESCDYQITAWAEDLAILLTPSCGMQQPGPCRASLVSTHPRA